MCIIDAVNEWNILKKQLFHESVFTGNDALKIFSALGIQPELYTCKALNCISCSLWPVLLNICIYGLHQRICGDFQSRCAIIDFKFSISTLKVPLKWFVLAESSKYLEYHRIKCVWGFSFFKNIVTNSYIDVIKVLWILHFITKFYL